MDKCLIADRALEDLYAKKLAEKIGASLLTVEAGEGAKSAEVALQTIDALCKMGADRNTTLIALGGGTITDLVGWIASVYLRGVRLILIPTTLLAMVDAAIGGKTAINTAFGKNIVGTTYPPTAVLLDYFWLKTLPEKEWLNGYAEILKIGLVRSLPIWRGEGDVVKLAIQEKMEVVRQDPKDRGIRRILNFGHTIGHGLEKLSQYQMSHGEAVAIGCLAEAHLSMQLGFLGKEEFDAIRKRYFPLPLPKGFSGQKLSEAMAHDKKREGSCLRFVLIDQIGHAMDFGGTYCRSVSRDELESTLCWMEDGF